MKSPEEILKLDNGKIADYHTVRDRVFQETISYYGAAGGGPWFGFLGLASLYLTLAALGNCVSLCCYRGLISEDLCRSILDTLQYFHTEIKRESNPF